MKKKLIVIICFIGVVLFVVLLAIVISNKNDIDNRSKAATVSSVSGIHPSCIPYDFNSDEKVDIKDFAEWRVCYQKKGAGVITASSCGFADLLKDDSVDIKDFAMFVVAYSNYRIRIDKVCDPSYVPPTSSISSSISVSTTTLSSSTSSSSTSTSSSPSSSSVSSTSSPSRDTILGTECDGIFTASYCYPNYIQNTDTSFLRIAHADWRTGEATKGTYTFNNNYLTSIQYLNNLGIRPILIIRTVPDWASSDPGHACGPIKPSNYIDYANYVNKVIDTYGLTYVELFNEPDFPGDVDGYMGCFTTGKLYTDMLKVVYPLIKSAHPYAQVIAGSIGGDPSSTWMVDAVSNGIGTYSDIVSFHAYQVYGESYTTTISHERTLKLKTMLPGKPLMMSEGAMMAGTDTVTPAIRAAQATHLQSSIDWAQKDGLVAYIHFRITNFPYNFHTELIDSDGTPNAIYNAYKNLPLNHQAVQIYNTRK